MATTTKKTQAAKSRTVALKKAEAEDPQDLPALHVSDAAASRGIAIEVEGPEESTIEGVPVRLVGQDYQVHPPKMAMALKIGKASRLAMKADDPEKIADVLSQWVTAAFGKRIGKDVMNRLEDADDRLDYNHIMELIEALITYQQQGLETANPPT